MAKYDKIDGKDLLARWVRKKHMARDDSNNVITDDNGHPRHVFPQAFELRPNEGALSLTNVDQFTGEVLERKAKASEAFRQSLDSKSINNQDAFCFAIASAILDDCGAYGHKVRIIEDPREDNDAHCLVTSYPEGASLLQEHLADQTFSDRLLYRAIKAG